MLNISFLYHGQLAIKAKQHQCHVWTLNQILFINSPLATICHFLACLLTYRKRPCVKKVDTSRRYGDALLADQDSPWLAVAVLTAL